MMYTDGQWNDLYCDTELPYVCKRPFSSTPIDPVTPTTKPPDSPCGSNWIEDTTTGICYRVEEYRYTFSDAKDHCQNLHYSDGESQPNLVTFSSIDEELFVNGNLLDITTSTPFYMGLLNFS